MYLFAKSFNEVDLHANVHTPQQKYNMYIKT